MSDKDSGTATFRALDILAAIAGETTPVGIPELCVKLALPKPTVYRLCQKLESENYLTREPDGRHLSPGPRLMRLSLETMSHSVGGRRRTILEQLVEQAGETCNFATCAGLQVMYLDRVEAQWPLRLHLESGSRVPIHCTASGKLFLSAMPTSQRRRMFKALDLKRFTPNTLIDIPALERECDLIEERGYSLDNEEFLEGICAIAVPVRNEQDAVLAAVASHGPLPRFTLQRAVTLLPHLFAASRALAQTLV